MSKRVNNKKGKNNNYKHSFTTGKQKLQVIRQICKFNTRKWGF